MIYFLYVMKNIGLPLYFCSPEGCYSLRFVSINRYEGYILSASNSNDSTNSTDSLQ